MAIGAVPEDRYVSVDGVRTRFWSMGEDGTPVILLHGIGCSVETWEKNIAALSREHRVYAVDIMGFGRSDKPDVGYSFPLLTDFVLRFMNTVHIEKASLIGNSMGGGISMLAALAAPERVDRLVLVDSFGFGREVSPVLRLMGLPMIGEVLSRPGRKGTENLMKFALYDPSCASNDLIERVTAMAMLPGAQRAFLTMLRPTITMGGVKKETLAPFSEINRIEAPALVVWGRQDRILPATHGEIAVEKLPNAQLHLIDRAGHFSQMDQPEEFNRVVLEFLRGR